MVWDRRLLRRICRWCGGAIRRAGGQPRQVLYRTGGQPRQVLYHAGGRPRQITCLATPGPDPALAPALDPVLPFRPLSGNVVHAYGHTNEMFQKQITLLAATALLLDRTPEKVTDNYFMYSDATVVEAKKIVLEVRSAGVSIDAAREGLREQLVHAGVRAGAPRVAAWLHWAEGRLSSCARCGVDPQVCWSTASISSVIAIRGGVSSC